MAKKNFGSDLSTDEIIDSLAEDVGVDDAEATIRDDGPPRHMEEGLVRPHVARRRAVQLLAQWPIDPNHNSAAKLFTGESKPISAELDEDAKPKQSGGLNFVLFLLIVAVVAGGVYGFNEVASEEALEAKRLARKEREEEHARKMLEMQKKYGLLRIVSVPPQAIVMKGDEPIMVPDEETGEKVVAKTPMNMMDLDIGEIHSFRLELDGYEPFDFRVGEHVWTKDAATAEYKLLKSVDLIPINCEYWFLYDAQKKKEMKFEKRGECAQYHDESQAQQRTVTDCTCKTPAEGAEVEKK